MLLDSKLPVKKGKKFLIKEIYEYRPNPNVDTYDIIVKFTNKFIDDKQSSKNIEIYDFEYDCTEFILEDDDLYEIAKKLVVIRYKIEEFNEIVLESFLIIDISGFFYYTGHQKGIDFLKEYFAQEFTEISFGSKEYLFVFQHEFLLWTILKSKEKEPHEMAANFLIINAERIANKKNHTPLLMAFLFNLDIIYGLVLYYKGYKLKFDIHNYQSIVINSSHLRKYDYLERFIIALYIINNLLKIHDKWILPDNKIDRSVDQEEFKKLKDECKGILDLASYTYRIRTLFTPKKKSQEKDKSKKDSKNENAEITVYIKKRMKKTEPLSPIKLTTIQDKDLIGKRITEEEWLERTELRKKKNREYARRRRENETPEQKQKRTTYRRQKLYLKRVKENLGLIDETQRRLNLSKEIEERAKELFTNILSTQWAGKKNYIILALICVFQASNEANRKIKLRYLLVKLGSFSKNYRPLRKALDYYKDFIKILNLSDINSKKNEQY